jgi:hypothetical protein
MSTATYSRPPVSSCREALAYLAAGHDKTLTVEQQATCKQLARFMERHPVLGLVMQQAILHRYYQAHGATDIKAAVDWKSILEWLVANMPTILQMLISLLTAFGGDQPKPNAS